MASPNDNRIIIAIGAGLGSAGMAAQNKSDKTKGDDDGPEA